MQPQPTPPVQSGTTALDPAEQYLKRKRTALWCTFGLLALSLVILTVGLVASTRTDNVAVAGFYPGIILSFGSFLGIVGTNLLENRRPMLIAAIIFISLGIKSCFFCAIIDGVIAAEFLDMRPLLQGRCSFYSSGAEHAYGSYYTGAEDDDDDKRGVGGGSKMVACPSYKCDLRVKTDSCYCCDLYNCERPEHYYEFIGVRSCWDVIHLHRLLWTCVALNVSAAFLGIITAAFLGAFKDLSSTPPQPPLPHSPAPVPHILYNPTQHLVSYPGFCPPGQALPMYPNYSIPMQHHGSYLPPTSNLPQPNAEASPAPLEETQLPSPNPDSPLGPSTSQADPSSCVLVPNAPMLYPQPFGILEKPPPYAC